MLSQLLQRKSQTAFITSAIKTLNSEISETTNQIYPEWNHFFINQNYGGI